MRPAASSPPSGASVSTWSSREWSSWSTWTGWYHLAPIEWATAGPHLTQVMGAGARGTGVFLSEALQEYERVWSRLARWDTLSAEDRQRLIRLIERVYDEAPSDLRAERDRFLARLLRVIEPHTDVELTLEEDPGAPNGDPDRE